MQDQHINFNVRARAHIGDYSCNIFSSRDARKSFYCSLAGLAVFFLSFVFVPYFMLEASASQNAAATVSWGAVSLTLDPDYGNGDIDDEGHGDIEFGEIVPTENSGNNYGTLKVMKKTIGITSSGKYYSVYLSTENDNNNLNLQLASNSQDTTINIPAITASFTEPATFSDSAWGYAVPGVDGAGVENAPATFVVPSLIEMPISSATNLDGASNTYNNTKWSPVPAVSAPQMIWKAEAQGEAGLAHGFSTYTDAESNTVTGDTENNHFDIYYGIAIDTDVLAGTYTNKIVYTAMASASSLDTVSRNLMNSLSIAGSGDTETIRFDLTQSTTTLNESDIIVTLVPHDVMLEKHYNNGLTFDITTLGSTNELGYLNCPVVAGSLSVAGHAEVKCTLPASAPETSYDFWVHVNNYNYDYISSTTVGSNQYVAAVTYAGLQSEYPSTDPRYNSASGADNHMVKEMQQMTQGICSNTNMWNNETGSLARLYDYTGLGGQIVADRTTEVDGETVVDGDATALASDTLGTGSFKLIDNRDNKPYLVRRLADGNCWMVQNLDLNLADFAGTNNLTSDNTNLKSKEVWDPSASAVAAAQEIDSTVTSANYMSVFSNAYFGSNQTYQFQPKDTKGATYHWGTKFAENITCTDYSDATTCTESKGAGLDPAARIPLSTTTGTIAGGTHPINSSYMYVNGNRYNYSSWAYRNGTSIQNGSFWVENNSISAWPRSYDNGYDWINQSNYADHAQSNGKTANYGGYTNLPSETWNYDHATTYLGDYYNWYAATAESGTWNMSTDSVAGSAEDSICPKGWRLPYNANTSGSWVDLLLDAYTVYGTSGTQTTSSNKYGTAEGPSLAMHELPLSIPFSGYYIWASGNLTAQGSGGYFWSSTPYAATYSRLLYFGSTFVRPQDGAGKTYGYTVRCVAKGDAVAEETQVATTCAKNKICYDANGGEGTMSTQSATASASATLANSTFTRKGAAFIGWSTSQSGYGDVYGATETITTPSTLGSAGLQLYAKWLFPTDTMQNFTAEKCAALEMEKPIALTDERDGNVYTVTHLKDGNCWMTSNLALNLADFAGTHKLTPENTDISYGLASTDEGYRAYWDPSASTQAKIVQYDAKLTELQLSKDFSGLSELLLGQAQPAQFQSGSQTGYRWGSKVSDDGNWTELSEVSNNSNAEMPRGYHDGNNTYGDYYNWYAATAESGTFAQTSGDAADSICPSGWQLPVNGDSGTDKSWQGLLFGHYTTDDGSTPLDSNAESSLIMGSLPLSIPFSGGYTWSNGGFYNRGSGGYFWSSSAHSSCTDAYNLTFRDYNVRPQDSSNKVYGSTVRCVRR